MASISASGCNSFDAPSDPCTSSMLGAPASIHSILFSRINANSILSYTDRIKISYASTDPASEGWTTLLWSTKFKGWFGSGLNLL